MINPSLMESCNVSMPGIICFSDVYFCCSCTSIIPVFCILFKSFDFVTSLSGNWYLSSIWYMLVCFIDALFIHSIICSFDSLA